MRRLLSCTLTANCRPERDFIKMIDTNEIKEVDTQMPTNETMSRLHRLACSRLGIWIIAAIAFFEAALPIPLLTDPFIVGTVLVDRTRAKMVVLVATAASILGGIAAFAMAAFFFDIVSTYMTADNQAEFQSLVAFGQSNTLVATFVGAFTPIPYTITAWVIAAANGSIWLFLVGSILGRGIRYSILGYCTYKFGQAALLHARRSVALTSVLVFAMVVLYALYKL